MEEITRMQIAECASEILENLVRLTINSVQNLDEIGDINLNTNAGQGSFIHLHKRASNSGTLANKVSYIGKGKTGIALEVVINPSLNYIQLIIKSSDLFDGYEIFAKQGANLVQFKKIEFTCFDVIYRELESLKQQG